MQRKKVLIITRDFIPFYGSLGGVLRVLKMAQFFDAKGFDVFLLAAKGQKISYFGYEQVVKNLDVYYLPDALQYRDTRKFNQQRHNYKASKLHENYSTKRIKSIIKELSVPDLGIYFVQKYFREATKIIKENHIRNVIVSSPPHSTQIIGLKLKKRFRDKINLIVDYRDSWNTTKIFQKNIFLTKVLSEGLEKKILKAADHFVYCSPPILYKINTKFFDIRSKSLLVINGFDPTMKLSPPCVTSNNEHLLIGHFGNILEEEDSFRNPTRLFEALSKLNKKIKIVFYGDAQISELWQDRLKGSIEFKGVVPHTEALRSMQKMDALMLLHSKKESADEVITGKLFEYILVEKPILVVGPENMEAARIVINYGLGYCINLYNQEDILDKMNRIYSEWMNGALPRYKKENLNEFSRHYQYSKMLGILE